jgi:hypothetical protein
LETLHRGVWRAVICLVAAGGTGQVVDAGPISYLTVLEFDELPFQSVDDLTVAGVTFDFKVDGTDSNEAFYHSFGPGTLTHVDDPSLTGDARGTLTLTFTQPVGLLEFGVSLNTAAPIDPGVVVQLVGEHAEVIDVVSVPVTASGILGFSEAVFRHLGAPVHRAVISFADGPSSFAVDNLTFGVPEPATGTLLAVSLAALARISHNRRRERS